jgi:hypothetical protein
LSIISKTFEYWFFLDPSFPSSTFGELGPFYQQLERLLRDCPEDSRNSVFTLLRDRSEAYRSRTTYDIEQVQALERLYLFASGPT